MSTDVPMTHPETGVRALLPAKVAAGWARLGWVHDNATTNPPPSRPATTKRPALVPDNEDDSTAGASPTTTE